MPADLWRLWALIDMAVLCACGVVFYLHWRPTTTLQRLATAPFAGLVLLVGCSVAVNMAARLDLTPGVVLAAIFATPLALIALYVVARLRSGADR